MLDGGAYGDIIEPFRTLVDDIQDQDMSLSISIPECCDIYWIGGLALSPTLYESRLTIAILEDGARKTVFTVCNTSIFRDKSDGVWPPARKPSLAPLRALLINFPCIFLQAPDSITCAICIAQNCRCPSK